MNFCQKMSHFEPQWTKNTQKLGTNRHRRTTKGEANFELKMFHICPRSIPEGALTPDLNFGVLMPKHGPKYPKF